MADVFHAFWLQLFETIEQFQVVFIYILQK